MGIWSQAIWLQLRNCIRVVWNERWPEAPCRTCSVIWGQQIGRAAIPAKLSVNSDLTHVADSRYWSQLQKSAKACKLVSLARLHKQFSLNQVLVLNNLNTPTDPNRPSLQPKYVQLTVRQDAAGQGAVGAPRFGVEKLCK